MKCAECVDLGFNLALGSLTLEACPKLEASLECINKLHWGYSVRLAPTTAPLLTNNKD